MDPEEVLRIWGSKDWERHTKEAKAQLQYISAGCIALANNKLERAKQLLELGIINEALIRMQIHTKDMEFLRVSVKSVRAAIGNLELLRAIVTNEAFLRIYCEIYNLLIAMPHSRRRKILADVKELDACENAEEVAAQIMEEGGMDKKDTRIADLNFFLTTLFIPGTLNAMVMDLDEPKRK